MMQGKRGENPPHLTQEETMHILMTGGAGFLGAWIIRRLGARGHRIRVFDVGQSRDLAAAIAGRAVAEACEWVSGDVVSRQAVHEAATGCDAVIHLAGVLTPFCMADPIRGAEVNLIGTLVAFEAARAHGIRHMIYTSSAGVYGPDDGVAPRPISHYGAFKLACEGSARAYWTDHKLASIAFRPYVVYGPGRETGLTAAPTLACKAAARGESYRFGYTGAAGLVYVDDVAAAYEAALEREPDGAHVFNLPGITSAPEEIVAEIRRLQPGADISLGGGPRIPLVAEIEQGAIHTVFPHLPQTGLREGLAATLAFYRDNHLPAS
jgi:UDP-glucose 4-epimerase